MFVMFAVYAACITRGFVALLSFYSPFLLPLSMLSMLFQAKTERILCRDRGNAPVSRACESAGTTLLAGCFCLHKGHKVNLDIYPRAWCFSDGTERKYSQVSGGVGGVDTYKKEKKNRGGCFTCSPRVGWNRMILQQRLSQEPANRAVLTYRDETTLPESVKTPFLGSRWCWCETCFWEKRRSRWKRALLQQNKQSNKTGGRGRA